MKGENHYRILDEKPDHFVVHDGEGSFRVAKKGLAPGLLSKIQKFHRGGEVKGYADGGEVLPGDGGYSVDDPSDYSPPQPMPGGVPLAGDAAYTPDVADPNPGYVPPPAIHPFEAPTIHPGDPASGAVPEPDYSKKLPRHGELVSDAEAAAQAGTGGGGAADIAQSAQPASAPAMAPMLNPMGGPGIPGGIARGEREELAGINAQAQAAKTLAANQSAVQDQYIHQRQALLDDFNKRMSAHQSRSEQLFNDVLQSKVDPNRLYSSMSTGQRIGSAVAMILGGLGSGLTGGSNQALEVLNKQIDRDVDAQKVNLDNRRTLLGHYLQMGRTMQEAHSLAKADLMDLTAAKMLKAATDVGGQQAMANAQIAAGQLRQKSAVLRQEAETRSLQNEQAKLGMAFQRTQMAAMGQFLSGQGGASGGGGAKMDPRAIALLPKEIQEKLVTLPDGTYATVRNPRDAETVSKTQEAAAVLRDKLRRYGSLLKEHPHGVSSTLSPNDYATAEALHDSILTDLNGLAGLNRFTEQEAKLFGGRVPDLREKKFFAQHQAKLDELGREIADKVWETNQTYLNLPRRPRPGQ